MTTDSSNQTTTDRLLCSPQGEDNQNRPIQVVRHIKIDETIELPLHHHEQDLFVFVQSGYLRCYVDQGYWLVPAQSAIWIPAGQAHSNDYKKETHVAFAFIKKNDQFATQTKLLSIPSWMRELLLYLASHEYPTSSDRLQDQMAHVFLQGLKQAEALNFFAPLPSQEGLKQMAEQIMHQPQQRKKLTQWAEEFHCSERTLARRILTHTGLSFSKWQQLLLVLLAIQQLSNEKTIKQISFDLGYESTSAFIAVFKKHVKMTPKQFYQRFLKSPIN